MANNTKWNGMILGGVTGGLLGFFVQKIQAVAPATNFANTIWSDWMVQLSNKIIASWSGFAGVSTDIISYSIFVIVGLLIGLYVENK